MNKIKMCMIGFAVLGFEEKFISRCMIRNYEELRKFYLIIPGRKSEKLENAMRVIRSVADAAGVQIEEIVFGELNMMKIYQRLLKLMRNLLVEEEVLLCLSSGLRGVGISLLLAAVEATKYASPARVKISVDWENLSGHEEYRLSDFLSVPALKSREREILTLLSEEPMSARQLSMRLGIPYATAWRAIKRLEELGYLRRRGKRLEITRAPFWILRE